MNTAHKIHIPSVIESFVEALEDVDLSSSEKVVLCRLRLFIGYDKYKRISVKKIGEKCKFCESRTREILSSLVSKGRLIRIIQRGRTNLWAFPDQACRKTPTEVRPHLSPIKKEENVKNQKPKANVISLSSLEQPKEPEPQTDTHEPKETDKPPIDSLPKKKPIPMHVVKALVEVTNDRKSFGLWCKVARDVPLDDIRYSVEALRIAQNDNSVRNSGRYLVSILKSRCPEVFTHKTSPGSNSKPDERSVTHAKCPTAPVEPQAPPDYATGLSAIAKIRTMLGGLT